MTVVPNPASVAGDRSTIDVTVAESVTVGNHIITIDATGSEVPAQSVQLTVSGTPHIDGLNKKRVRPSARLKITGTGFSGTSTRVLIRKRWATVVSLSDSAIVVRVPNVKKGKRVKVRVLRDGIWSDNAALIRIW